MSQLNTTIGILPLSIRLNRRDEIINEIRALFQSKNNKSLTLYGVPDATLGAYVTDKKDKHKSKLPLEKYKLSENNIQSKVCVPSINIKTPFNIQDAQILYPLCRKELVTTTLEDFNILQIICTGTSGKLFLVENVVCNKLFVMKAITKDKLKESTLVELTKIEEEINKRVNT